jgi:hypothetical protein
MTAWILVVDDEPDLEELHTGFARSVPGPLDQPRT